MYLRKDILKSVNLPCFIYDTKEVDKQLTKLYSSFSEVNENVKIFYSYKTNPVLGNYLSRKGLGMQVTSLHHLKEALKIVSGKDIIFSSRELSKTLVRFLMKNRVHIIVNSEEQLALVNSINRNYPIGIRVDTQVTSRKTSFAASNLGLGISYKKIKSISSNVRGFHNHLASQITDLVTYKQSAKILIDLATKFDVNYINIGGGLPIDYSSTKVPNINQFANCFTSWRGKLFLEPGRFLVGPSGKLLLQVVEKHDNIIVVNASLFNSVRDRILSNYQIKLPIVEKGNSYRKVVGNSPSSCDFFGNYKLNKNASVLTFLQAGAYCITDDKFTGVEKPREYIVLNNKIKMIQ